MAVTSQTSSENINTFLSHIKDEHKVALSVDCVIFGYMTGELKVLLLECNMPPFVGQYSLVGDLIQSCETLEESALKILKQRTGITDLYLKQVGTFSSIDRHPLGRVISTAYYTIIKENDYAPRESDNSLKVVWKSIDKIEDLAFDHNVILKKSLETLRWRVRNKPFGMKLLPKKFTLKELQALYEAVLGIELDKRNFRRKLKNSNLLVAHKESQQDVKHRPAQFYSFNLESYNRQMASETVIGI